jgi:hypothetical protein
MGDYREGRRPGGTVVGLWGAMGGLSPAGLWGAVGGPKAGGTLGGYGWNEVWDASPTSLRPPHFVRPPFHSKKKEPCGGR